MTSFMQTMFVPPPPALSSTSLLFTTNTTTTPPHSPLKHHQFPCAGRPLSPLASNIFATTSTGGGGIGNGLSLDGAVAVALPEVPREVYESPLQRHFRDVLHSSPSSSDPVLGRVAPPPPPPSSSRSASPTRRDKVLLPRLKAGRAHRRAAHVDEEDEDEDGDGDGDGDDGRRGETGLGTGLDFILAQADLLTWKHSNANARTRSAFKPQRAQKGTNSWQLKQFAEATLGSGSLKKVVKLPEGEDKDEWLAVNIVDFYNQINLLYGAITEFCSPQTCPEMKATDEFEYLWHNPPDFPKPTRLPAPTYISHLLSWTSTHLSNPDLFPTAPGVPFPANFPSSVRQIFKRLYRVYAHIYCHHYSVVRGLGLEAHLNTGFKHYVLFVEEFGLADVGDARREWFGPLGELVDSMVRSE